MGRVAFVALTALLGWMPQVRDRVVAPDAVGTAALSGRVTIDVNGTPQPVRRARVTLEADAITKPRRMDTDTEGRYRFERLPAGLYRIRAEKAGFVPRLGNPRRAFEKPPEFRVGEGVTLARDLPMVRGAALDGRILTDAGPPAVNVMVSAMRFSYTENGRRATVVRQTRTDDRGAFRVHTLPAGEYYLEAGPDPLDVLRQAPVPGRRPTILARMYYPGFPRIEGGESIPLVTGQNATGLEFSLPTITTAVLRGKVHDSTGDVARAMFVRVQRVGGPIGEVRGSTNPSTNEFMYPSAPPGEYWLMGVARRSPTADLEFAATRITVNDLDMPDLSLTTAKGAVVNGRVEVEGGTPPALQTLQVLAHETEFELPSLPEDATAGAAPVVAPNGTFSFRSLFGPRLFRLARLPAGWILRRVTLDDVDVTDTTVDFRGGESPRTLRIVITSRASSVSGIVRDEAGRPATTARVVVFSEDEKTWGWRSRMVKSAECGADGRYTIDGLPDGKYYIAAVPFLEDGSWMDVTILRRLQPIASSIAVANAAKLTTNLVVKP